MVKIATEPNIDVLRKVALLQERELVLLRRRIDEITRKLAELQGSPADEAVKRQLFHLEQVLNPHEQGSSLGQGSERRSLLDEIKPEKKTKKPRSKSGRTKQPNLPVTEVIYPLDEADMACPKCGGALLPIDGQFEEAETIDVVEAHYVVRKEKRIKYRCNCSTCQHIETALGPEDKLPGSRYTLNFAASVALNKYQFHLPLTRQVKMLAQEGLNVTSQTLWGLLYSMAKLLFPSYEALGTLVLEQKVVGADETRWRLMDGKAPSKHYVFILSSLVGLYYTFKESKSAKTVAEVIGNFSGWLVVDGASTYTCLYEQRQEEYRRMERDDPPFDIASCWFHCRRYYFKAEKDFPEAGRMLDLIAMLYRVVGAAAQDPTLDPELRRAWVEAILAEMKRWMSLTRVLGSSSLGKAIAYTQKFWPRLTAFLDHPEVWLDNNLSEQALRQPVMGRHNHYGSRSQEGMRVAAILYSLIETCKLLGVDPRAYLLEALKRALENPKSVFLPHEMLK